MTTNKWTKLQINKFTDNYFLREQGVSVRKPYNDEFALIYDEHYTLAKNIYKWKQEQIQKEVVKRKRYY